MSKPARSDSGFVLLDALLAAGLIAFAGTTIIVIVNSVLGQQERELDRSVALVAMQSLVKQYLLLTGKMDATLEREDELYVYRFQREAEPVAGTSALVEMTLLAAPKFGRDPVRLDFLAPAPSP